MNWPFRGSQFRPQMRSIVIAVDGAARGNSNTDPNSRGGWGVFWGKNCKSNDCGILAPDVKQTNSRAELEAVRQALRGLLRRRANGELLGWKQVIIKLDSDYVKKTFDEYISEWQKRGWKKSDGKVPKHLGLIQEIHSMILDIELNGAVRFWRVDREWNKDADALANKALDEAVVSEDTE
jgi:ribonuclease HI